MNFLAGGAVLVRSRSHFKINNGTVIISFQRQRFQESLRELSYQSQNRAKLKLIAMGLACSHISKNESEV